MSEFVHVESTTPTQIEEERHLDRLCRGNFHIFHPSGQCCRRTYVAEWPGPCQLHGYGLYRLPSTVHCDCVVLCTQTCACSGIPP
ncbi:hypothetical protein J6590_063841 [Homalodisca vitripennis]|nr:hypothetical protein J6590_063841 [Homalodisca vitripennis]